MKSKNIMFLLAASVFSSAALFIGTTAAQQQPATQPQAAAPTAEAPQAPAPLQVIAGVDRDVINPGQTYLTGRAGYNLNRAAGRGNRQGAAPQPALPPAGADATVTWSKESGPGDVSFENPKAGTTTATFSKIGDYVLKLTADNGTTKVSSTLKVSALDAPPTTQLDAVNTADFKIDSPLWNSRAKALIVGWIPHCVDMIENPQKHLDARGQVEGPGGIDNFIEAAKKLQGLPAARHLGYPFSNAWVHQTVESMSIALMVDPQGDKEIIDAQAGMRKTLDKWIPIILAAQEPDGYLQTRFTLNGGTHWSPATRGEHEGYTAGYFLESAINHYNMTGHKDPRMYNAAKKLADCWNDNLGPATELNSKGQPKHAWYDGHQEMEQALVRFGRYVNDIDGPGKGDKYIKLAKFLLDCRGTARGGSDYDQSQSPVIQQYEAVGHAVRAAYTYSGMADVAVETHNIDYQSAVMSLWDNVVNKKWYVTGGIGSGETSEGFGPNYSLRNGAYCESCSTCGEIFFQYKMDLAYQDAKYVDLYEDSIYNALLGAIDMKGTIFNYTNPLQGGNRTSWNGCPCCVGNIPRTLLMIPTWTYARSKDSIFVNLFIGSTATIQDIAGTSVQMVQKTDYPWSGKVNITVNPAEAKNFTLKVRVPDHSVSQLYKSNVKVEGFTSLAVNGTPVKDAKIDKGYITLTRDWKAGDKIDVEFPMEVQEITADPKIQADVGLVCLRYGPLIYSFEAVDQDVSKTIAANAKLTTEWAPDMFHAVGNAPEGVDVIKGTFADGSPLLAIPYYARLNRGAAGGGGRGAGGQGQGGGRAASSTVWMREAQ